MRYLPALDGLRAIAVLAVVCVHAGAPFATGGFVGVDVFFVLSGYLITRVLAESPDLRRFYWRRALRLVPPLALMLAAYLLLFPLAVPDYPHGRDAALAFFYLSDYSIALSGAPNYLMHTWSLAVEEHFYLIWPLLFLRWRPSVKVLAVAYVAATAWRWMQPDWSAAYFRFDVHCSGLILGCLIAHVPRVKVAAWPGMLVIGAAAALLTMNGPLAQGPGIAFVELATALVILGQQPAWLSHPALAYLGKLSYGVYLWHYPIIRFMEMTLHRPGWSLQLPVALLGSVAMAAMSYHTIEAFARRASSRHTGSRAPSAETAPATHRRSAPDPQET